MKLQIDKTGDVERIFKIVTEEKYQEEFEFLCENAIFQFTTREKPQYDEEGLEIAATAQRLSNRERDLYGSDFEICVYLEYWETLSDAQKERIMYHELLHCCVYEDEDDYGNPAFDNDGRIVISMVPHDLVVKTFQAEIEEFGLSESDLKLAEFFYNQYKKHLEKNGAKKHGDAKQKRRK